MLRFLHGRELSAHDQLARQMFRHRADQFGRRLGWDVSINPAGEEHDNYDALDPLYVIWQRPDGSHGGSMRFLPTLGRTMVNEVFGHLTGGRPIIGAQIWECSRFCLAPDADQRTSAALMLGGGTLMEGFGLRHFVGVFDQRMERIYRCIGATPQLLGSHGGGRDRIGVGLWSFSRQDCTRVAGRAGVPESQARAWFREAFGDVPIPRFAPSM